jgi:putative transposase
MKISYMFRRTKFIQEKAIPIPRKLRVYLPGIPNHVVQRGNGRNPCFFEEDNYWFLLDCLGDACERYDVAIHAYVFMTNHIHLLMTPCTESGISRVMQWLGNRWVQYTNKIIGKLAPSGRVVIKLV